MLARGSVFSGALYFFSGDGKSSPSAAGWPSGRWRSSGRDGHLCCVSLPPFPSSFLQNSVSECQVSLGSSDKCVFFRSLSADDLRRIVGGGPGVSGREFVVALVSSRLAPRARPRVGPFRCAALASPVVSVTSVLSPKLV